MCQRELLWLQRHQRTVLRGECVVCRVMDFVCVTCMYPTCNQPLMNYCLSLHLSSFPPSLQPGEEWYLEDCKLKCYCNAPFVTCNPSDCPPMHECKVQGGELDCYPTSKSPDINSPYKHPHTQNGVLTFDLLDGRAGDQAVTI